MRKGLKAYSRFQFMRAMGPSCKGFRARDVRASLCPPPPPFQNPGSAPESIYILFIAHDLTNMTQHCHTISCSTLVMLVGLRD